MSTPDSAASENAANQALGASMPSAGSARLAELPAPLRAVIATVCKRARLWTHERADVEAELAAHFHDGLAQGTAPDKLIADFGDPKAAAKLIRRGKIRNRPWWWQTWHRFSQAVACLLAFVLACAVFHTYRFYSGTPTITLRPIDELNREAIALPESDRAWPIYRAAYLSLNHTREQHATLAALRVATPPNPDASAALDRIAAPLSQIRAASAKPGLGYLTSVSPDREISAKNFELFQTHAQEGGHAIQPDAQNPEAFALTLSHLGTMRECVRLLRADAIAAMHRADAEHTHANLAAMISISQQLRTPDTLISSLVSCATTALAADTTRELLTFRPSLLSDAQLTDLAHRFAALGGPREFVSVRGERVYFRDAIQRLYTDDGHGNGHLTSAGAAYFDKLAALGSDTGSVGMLLTSVVSVDRKELTRAFERLLDRAEAAIDVPLWQKDVETADRVLDEYTATPLARVRYLPLAVLAPALDRVRYTAQEIATRRDSTLAVIAIELQRRATGQFPESLAQLVPARLPVVPRDLADGTPLRYRRSGDSYVLYSLGADGQDDHGARPVNDTDAFRVARFQRRDATSKPCDLVYFPAVAPEPSPQP
ncbi:MAG TPA: hypothetical protein VF777_02790 [Phycisphaerales bacterium]